VTNETIEEDEDEEDDVSIDKNMRACSQFPENSQRDDKFPTAPHSPIKLRRTASKSQNNKSPSSGSKAG